MSRRIEAGHTIWERGEMLLKYSPEADHYILHRKDKSDGIKLSLRELCQAAIIVEEAIRDA